ncbi:MiaB/RimO family radical SAM methylthiotransferase [Desulfonatronospira sp.]|uniref:MiaB/RimO family radical SAM methylthiotransferase n=1 Tax=Desulfonatronospira sp. TaxID=1962951 RepID=UPI0025B9A8C3|nr:MiaB/RimO family radical SAM methylthiotransferase [Desulfonatronospira sp.]
MSSESFFLATLGCRVNQYESQAISEALQRRGLLRVETPEQAGNIYVNSCAVTARAVQDLKKSLRRLKSQAPQARIIVTGCAAQAFKKELSALKEVDLVVPQSGKKSLLTSSFPKDYSPDSGRDFYIHGYFRARPVVKVQDGCSRGCSFCIVPSTRGAPASRSPEVVLREIQGLVKNGYREVVISGINLALYGVDLGTGHDFWDLVQYLEQNLAPQWQGRLRLRLSSLDPAQIDSRALDIISASSLLCPHFHLALQSASPPILARMRRSHYQPRDAVFFVEQMKSTLPLFALGADILVGFPGESPADFECTRELIQALPLTYAHVFTYSPRPGTLAAGFPDQITEHVKNQRSQDLKRVLKNKRTAFAHRLLQEKRLRLVMETSTTGMSEYYIKCELKYPSEGLNPGDTVSAAPSGIQDSKLLVEVLAHSW